MKKIGGRLLVFFVAISIFLGSSLRNATAQSRLESRIISDHEKIIQLREKKMNDCALVDNFPTSLIGICW